MTLPEKRRPGRPKQNIPKHPGRPPKVLDWKKVEALVRAGEPESRICAIFDMLPQAFIQKLRDQFPQYHYFHEYAQSIKEEGLAQLRINNYNRAMQGNTYCMQHLNKHMRGEWDKAPITDDISPKQQEIDQSHELMLLKAQLKEFQDKLAAINDHKPETRQELCGSDTPI